MSSSIAGLVAHASVTESATAEAVSRKEAPAAAWTRSAPEGTALDHTTLSFASGALHSAGVDDDVRTGRVATLRASIEAGTYSVPAAAVADKLLSEAKGGGAW